MIIAIDDLTAKKMEAKYELLTLLETLGITSAEYPAHCAWASHMEYILSDTGSKAW